MNLYHTKIESIASVDSVIINPNTGSLAAEATKNKLLELLEKRIEKIFVIAAQNGAEVLILGAFGGGAFCNPPKVVAQAFATVQERYSEYFETIEYAIYCRDYETANYDEFCKAFNQLIYWQDNRK